MSKRVGARRSRRGLDRRGRDSSGIGGTRTRGAGTRSSVGRADVVVRCGWGIRASGQPTEGVCPPTGKQRDDIVVRLRSGDCWRGRRTRCVFIESGDIDRGACVDPAELEDPTTPVGAGPSGTAATGARPRPSPRGGTSGAATAANNAPVGKLEDRGIPGKGAGGNLSPSRWRGDRGNAGSRQLVASRHLREQHIAGRQPRRGRDCEGCATLFSRSRWRPDQGNVAGTDDGGRCAGDGGDPGVTRLVSVAVKV